MAETLKADWVNRSNLYVNASHIANIIIIHLPAAPLRAYCRKIILPGNGSFLLIPVQERRFEHWMLAVMVSFLWLHWAAFH